MDEGGLLDRCVNLRYRLFRAIVTLLSSVIEFVSVFKQSDLVKLFLVLHMLYEICRESFICHMIHKKELRFELRYICLFLFHQIDGY